MRIHSGQCEKMGRSGTPHCKDISTISCHHHHHQHHQHQHCFSLPTDLECEAEHHVSTTTTTTTTSTTTLEHNVNTRETSRMSTIQPSTEELRESTVNDLVNTKHDSNTQTHSEVTRKETQDIQEDRVSNSTRNLRNTKEHSEIGQEDLVNTRKHSENTLGEYYQQVGRMAPRQGPTLWHPHQDECHRDAWHCVLGVPTLTSHPALEELILEPSRSKCSGTGGAGEDKDQPPKSYPCDANRSSKCKSSSSSSSQQTSSNRLGHRVRLYRKRVCVRLGSLQWSLALVLVVRSRPTTTATTTTTNTSCHTTTTHHHLPHHHQYHHHHPFSTPTSVRPLTVA